MTKQREDMSFMHPHTDKATWDAYQQAAKRIHFRRNPTAQDFAMVALWDVMETKARELESLALKVALLAAEEPSVRALDEYAALLRRVGKSL